MAEQKNFVVKNGLQVGDSASIAGVLVASGITYPTSDGSVNQVIIPDGSGNLTLQTVSYANLSNKPAILDSADVQSIVNATDVFDSAGIISLIDSAHVQLRQTPQDFAYVSLTGAPTAVSAFSNDAGYTTYDSGNTTGMLVTYATQTYVGTQISNLIDGAPDALNTLNEIAAALNDDSNAYVTLTSLINEKLDSAQVLAIADPAGSALALAIALG